MKAAYDCGVNFFDCAEGYAGGESEKVMGEAIKKFEWKRPDLVISTKVRDISIGNEWGKARAPRRMGWYLTNIARMQRSTGAGPLGSSWSSSWVCCGCLSSWP